MLMYQALPNNVFIILENKSGSRGDQAVAVYSHLDGGRRLFLLDGILGECFTNCKPDIGIFVCACPQQGEYGVSIVCQNHITLCE